MRMTDFRAGWPVVSNEGRRVGTIKAVGRHYIRTSRPGFLADLFIPASSVANVLNETIHLNVTQQDVDQMGWEQEPRVDDSPEADPEADLHRHI